MLCFSRMSPGGILSIMQNLRREAALNELPSLVGGILQSRVLGSRSTTTMCLMVGRP